MRILKIIGSVDIKIDLPQGTEIVSEKINDYLNTEYEEKFDMIFCIHALQTLWPHQLRDAVSKLVADLKDLGELHLHVPATDLACKKIIKNENDPLALYVLWGNVEDPFHSGFTLMWLRGLLMESKGVIIRNANTGVYQIKYKEQKRNVPEYVVVATIIRD